MIEDAVDAYEQAKKLGDKNFRDRESIDKNPYLDCLDEMLEGKKTAGEKRVGLKDIPLEDVAGTKTRARSESFAHNFMPLLPLDSEFGQKWVNLYRSQLDEGLRDPIKVYEYLHKYYVVEGNKRVSVMRFLDSPTIAAQVTRLMPPKDDSKESRLYYDYLDFAKNSHIDFLHFTQPGSYKKLDTILGLEDNVEWDQAQAEQLESAYDRFEALFLKKGGRKLKISSSDAFLVYLELYGITDLMEKSNADLDKEMTKIWPDFEQFPKKPEVKLVTSSDDISTGRKSILSMRFEPMKVAFVHSRDPETSSWTAKHEEAREYIQKMLPYDIKTKSYFNADGSEKEQEVMEQAIKDGAEVIFTTSPNMLRSSLKLAAKYPKLKILNCSLNTRTGHLRTYFARMFEVQFLFGMTAGILTKTGEIGYIADYPIYGMIANINAFALGVKMTNPEAKIFLDWSTTKKSMLDNLPRNIDITYIAGEEFDPQVLSTKEYGLYDSRTGQFLNLASITYYWGAFYLKMIQSILNNNWKRDMGPDKTESINYWYGLSNAMLDIQFSDVLPKQTKRLIQVMKEHMSEGHFTPFSTELIDQDGNVRNQEYETLKPDKIVNMDWLLDNITGTIPTLDDFSPDAKRVVRIHGIPIVKEVKEEEGDHEAH